MKLVYQIIGVSEFVPRVAAELFYLQNLLGDCKKLLRQACLIVCCCPANNVMSPGLKIGRLLLYSELFHADKPKNTFSAVAGASAVVEGGNSSPAVPQRTQQCLFMVFNLFCLRHFARLF